MRLVEITPERHGVELAIAYATPENFTGARIYGRAACYLHPQAAEMLARVAALAAAQGLRLRVFDGYRPPEAQWVLWHHAPDPDFVADPRRGSPHSRGVAVDLTLVTEGGAPLAMGTEFDNMTPRAYHGDTGVAREAQRNRALLLGLMTAGGWDHYIREWWHYQLFAPRTFPLIADGALAPPLMPAETTVAAASIAAQ